MPSYRAHSLLVVPPPTKAQPWKGFQKRDSATTTRNLYGALATIIVVRAVSQAPHTKIAGNFPDAGTTDDGRKCLEGHLLAKHTTTLMEAQL